MALGVRAFFLDNLKNPRSLEKSISRFLDSWDIGWVYVLDTNDVESQQI